MTDNPNGWSVTVGGSSARRPRIGDVLEKDLSGDEVIDLTKRFLEYYRGKAKRKGTYRSICRPYWL